MVLNEKDVKCRRYNYKKSDFFATLWVQCYNKDMAIPTL